MITKILRSVAIIIFVIILQVFLAFFVLVLLDSPELIAFFLIGIFAFVVDYFLKDH